MGRRIDLEMKCKLVHMVLGKVRRVRVCAEHSKSESAGTSELNEGAAPENGVGGWSPFTQLCSSALSSLCDLAQVPEFLTSQFSHL